MEYTHTLFQGLSDKEVEASRKQHGRNELIFKKTNGWLHSIAEMLKEPMLLMLIAASVIYFISGKIGDGLFMFFAIFIVSAISLFQESKSRNAIDALKNLSIPLAKVLRNNLIQTIPIEEMVLGDCMLIEEGVPVPADGLIIQANDFSVNESILTGESMAVNKKENQTGDNGFVFKGTTVASGQAFCTVTAIGNETRLGKIGKRLETIIEEATPLQLQINRFVTKMMIVGLIVFFIVWLLNFWRSHLFLDSLLKALTLAMSIVPEEIPVTFTTFMALGAWRMMKMGVLVKQTKTVEALGSATVICTDKTGTITENKMELVEMYVWDNQEYEKLSAPISSQAAKLLATAVWASEPLPFDPMEVALHTAYAKHLSIDERKRLKLIHEYPLAGTPPMMTHIFTGNNKQIVACKGAPEALLNVTKLTDNQKNQVLEAVQTLANKGYRVLAVADALFSGTTYPENQQDFPFVLRGLIAFYDPPKQSIAQVLQSFYTAGIQVKIVTGDNTATTVAIAKQVGFKGTETPIEGNTLMQMSDPLFAEAAATHNIFTRMFPEAKLRLIEALKANGAIVAMTGDGVNDGPALKAAHIGVAMGKKGTEIAKRAATLVLLNDDLLAMVDAVAMGRKIYVNIKKAIQYVISIHIPIVLIVFIPLILGWVYPNIFSPVHIIFLELIMGPTCSIIYENEPMEKNTMLQPPRPFTNTFFSTSEMMTSIVQGLAITIGLLIIYQYAANNLHASEGITRTMIFVTLITANIFLTLVNRSFYYSIITSLKNKNNLVLVMIGITILLSAILLLQKDASNFFGFEAIGSLNLCVSAITGAISVLWYEIIKRLKRRKHKEAM